jgi:hypothetical protein
MAATLMPPPKRRRLRCFDFATLAIFDTIFTPPSPLSLSMLPAA